MFSFFKKFLKPGAATEPAVAPAAPLPEPIQAAPSERTTARTPEPAVQPPQAALPSVASLIGSALVAPISVEAIAAAPERERWLSRLSAGLRKTSSNIASVFTGTQIDDALYEELETALLMADTGVGATEHLLADVKRRVKDSGVTHPVAVKNILIESLATLLRPLEHRLVIGEHQPTVIMVAGVNGAGKTTSIGKLTRHLSDAGLSVLLAAADTFRAAAKEQLLVWADRNHG
jgi:fused signal recognition particle receptor